MRYAIPTLSLAALALAYLVYLVTLAAISRRPRTRGLRDGRLRPCRHRTNCVCTQPGCGGRRAEPLPFSGPPEAALERLAAVVAGLPRSRIMRREGDYFHAEVRSRFFDIVDDVEALVDPTAGVIHLRSGSRVGLSDRGVNARRVETIRAGFLGRPT